MSGHSKWSNIKHKKAAEDKKRSKLFSKLAKNIRIAVKDGGDDPETNTSLRLWLDKAKEANFPKENIKRAIEAGLGRGEDGPIQEVVYEAFGPQGIGLLIACSTDNKNRTTAEVRHTLDQVGGSLGAPGSVSYMFDRNKQGSYNVTLTVPLQGEEHCQQLLDLIESLLALEDVEDVYCATDEIDQGDIDSE